MQLDIINVGPSDFGAYHCIAKNEMGITKGIFRVFGKLFLGNSSHTCEKPLLVSSCVSVCWSVHLCVCPHGTTWLPLDVFHET